MRGELCFTYDNLFVFCNSFMCCTPSCTHTCTHTCTCPHAPARARSAPAAGMRVRVLRMRWGGGRGAGTAHGPLLSLSPVQGPGGTLQTPQRQGRWGEQQLQAGCGRESTQVLCAGKTHFPKHRGLFRPPEGHVGQVIGTHHVNWGTFCHSHSWLHEEGPLCSKLFHPSHHLHLPPS